MQEIQEKNPYWNNICMGQNQLQKGSKSSSWTLVFTVSILNLPIGWKILRQLSGLSMLQLQSEEMEKVSSKNSRPSGSIQFSRLFLLVLLNHKKKGHWRTFCSLTLGKHTKCKDLMPVFVVDIGDM